VALLRGPVTGPAYVDWPDTVDWIADVDSAGNVFLDGAWLTVAGGFLGVVALVGFYDALSFFGFVGFFVFMASMGVSLLRRQGDDVPAAVAASG
jgi:hypothetical protein